MSMIIGNSTDNLQNLLNLATTMASRAAGAARAARAGDGGNASTPEADTVAINANRVSAPVVSAQAQAVMDEDWARETTVETGSMIVSGGLSAGDLHGGLDPERVAQLLGL